MSKARIHSLNVLFRIFEVDDSMPDPETYRDPEFVRPKPMGPSSVASLASQEPATFCASATYEKEVFRREVLCIDPETGRKLWAWLPCEVNRSYWLRRRT